MKYLLILLVICSCSKIPTNKFKEFEIKKYYTATRVNTNLKEPVVEGYFKFDSSCEYELTENVGQINKLIGIGLDNDPYENSIRIGWEWENDHYRMWSYYYIDGIRGSDYVTECVSNQEYYFRVEVFESGYHVIVNNELIIVPGNINVTKPRLLLPYFGEEQPFPGSIHGDNKCKIFIKLL